MFAPDPWPDYFREAKGCEVVDLDGNRYLDMTTMGIGACLLGYNDPDVSDAVVARVKAGSMCTLNSPEEVELAQLLLGITPGLRTCVLDAAAARPSQSQCVSLAPTPVATSSPSAATTIGTTGISRQIAPPIPTATR
jgi:4-aminobutyrate aminotransferase-like enzyme